MLQVPGWLKALYDWTKIVGLAVGVFSFGLAFIIGRDKGLTVASLIAALAMVFFIVIVVVRNAYAAVGEASSAVSDYDKWAPEKRREVLDGMKGSKNIVIFWTTVFAFIAAVASAFLLCSPVYHALYTKTPDKIEFAKISYFDASQQRLVEELPIVEAIVTSLKDEAQASGMNARIIVGTTRPFERPAPGFRFQVVIKDDNFQLSGYAFLTRGEGLKTGFQSVLPNYTEKDAVILSVPASETGDKVFFVGRLSLAPGKTDFPSEPETILGATIIAGGDHS